MKSTVNTKNQTKSNNLKTNIMKKKHLLFLTILLLMGRLNGLQAQSMNHDQADYNYTANMLINQKEIGEDVARDAANNLIYVAGEQRKDNSGQGVRVVKYDVGMTQLKTAKYDSIPFRESVKRIFFYSNKIYVVCNGIEETTGTPTLLLLRYNTSLVLEKSKWFFTDGYNSPADANFVSTNAIYIACYKRSGVANNFAVIRVDNDFNIVNYFNPAVTTYNRIPKKIVFNANDQGVYVCGGISDIATGNTAVMAMRLGSPLNLAWEKTGTLQTLKNIYNSIAVTNNNVYVAGCEKSGTKNFWTIRQLNKLNGNTVYTRTNGNTNYNSEVVKITYANTTDVTVVGYLSSSSLNEYRVKVIKYNAALTSYNSETVVLPFNSIINDAVTYVSSGSGTTHVTGSQVNGSDKNLFVYSFDYASISLDNSETVPNRNSGGNRIITLGSAWNFAITGYSDKNSGVLATDYCMSTWVFYIPIPRLENDKNETPIAEVRVFPNPAVDVLNIESSETLKTLALFDLQGKTVLQNEISDESLTQQVNISQLPKGIYFLRVNNGTAQRIVKN